MLILQQFKFVRLHFTSKSVALEGEQVKDILISILSLTKKYRLNSCIYLNERNEYFNICSTSSIWDLIINYQRIQIQLWKAAFLHFPPGYSTQVYILEEYKVNTRRTLTTKACRPTLVVFVVWEVTGRETDQNASRQLRENNKIVLR